MSPSYRGAGCLLLGWLAFETSCRPKLELPEGLPRAYVDEAVAIADESIQHCDRLIELPDCHGDYEEQPTDPSKAVPLPKSPLNTAPELQTLEVSCDTRSPPPGGSPFCRAPATIRRRIPGVCKEMQPFGKWPWLTGKDELSVFVPKDMACSEPWVQVAVRRCNRKERCLDVTAYFLSKTWLAAHPSPR
jgi:hypothetical protein